MAMSSPSIRPRERAISFQPSRSTTTLVYMMYTSGYRSSNYSLAACVSIFTFVLTLGFTVLTLVADAKKVEYT